MDAIGNPAGEIAAPLHYPEKLAPLVFRHPIFCRILLEYTPSLTKMGKIDKADKRICFTWKTFDIRGNRGAVTRWTLSVFVSSLTDPMVLAPVSRCYVGFLWFDDAHDVPTVSSRYQR